MSLFFVTLPAALDQFVAGALFLAFVTVVLLGLGGMIVIIYLLGRGLDGWMGGRRRDRGAVTWSVVDAEAEPFYYQQPLWDMADELEDEPAFKPEEPEWATPAPDEPFTRLVR